MGRYKAVTDPLYSQYMEWFAEYSAVLHGKEDAIKDLLQKGEEMSTEDSDKWDISIAEKWASIKETETKLAPRLWDTGRRGEGRVEDQVMDWNSKDHVAEKYV